MKVIIKIIIPIVLAFSIIACSRVSNSPKGCVTAFIIAVEQHDMGGAWGLLGKDAQQYYNNLGEKQRRSGKGALEHEVNRIKSFFAAGKGYSIRIDKDNKNIVKLVVPAGNNFIVETIDEEGDYKIKDENSVKNILSVIASRIEKEGYY